LSLLRLERFFKGLDVDVKSIFFFKGLDFLELFQIFFWYFDVLDIEEERILIWNLWLRASIGKDHFDFITLRHGYLLLV